jgi:hypothetical protein
VRANVHFDVSTRNLHFWDPWREVFEALPVVDSVTDRDGDRRFGGGARELHLKPSLQRGNRAACFRPGAPTDAPRRSCRGSALRSCKAQRSAAAPPRRSAPTRPWRSRRSAGAVGPAKRQSHGVADTAAAGDLLVGGIAVALHDAAVADEARNRNLLISSPPVRASTCCDLTGSAQTSCRSRSRTWPVNCGNCPPFTIRPAILIQGAQGRLESRQLGASTWD